jgi:predicted ester cyclase
MITALVQFRLPSPVTPHQARERFLEAAPSFQRVDGLVRKQFLLGEGGNVAGGADLWVNREAAEAFYNGPFREMVRKRYGSEPTITFFETPVLVENPSPGAENKAVVRRVFVEGFNAGDPSLVDELFAPEYVSHGPWGEVRGRELARWWIVETRKAFPDGQYTVEELIAEGDRVVTRTTFRGTHEGELMGPHGECYPPSGKPVISPGISIYRVQAKRIVAGWVVADFLTVFRQIGVEPARRPR